MKTMTNNILDGLMLTLCRMQFLYKREKLSSFSLVMEEANPKSLETEFNIFKDSSKLSKQPFFSISCLIFAAISSAIDSITFLACSFPFVSDIF